jgi:hypothetical protein
MNLCASDFFVLSLRGVLSHPFRRKKRNGWGTGLLCEGEIEKTKCMYFDSPFASLRGAQNNRFAIRDNTLDAPVVGAPILDALLDLFAG